MRNKSRNSFEMSKRAVSTSFGTKRLMPVRPLLTHIPSKVKVETSAAGREELKYQASEVDLAFYRKSALVTNLDAIFKGKTLN